MHTDLWNFAIALYARPGVEAACLELQAGGADVCLLLCAAWLDCRQTAVRPEALEALQRMAAPWQQEVVQPLRSLRQQWRATARQDTGLAALRERVKALELDAERLQLERMQALCDGWPGTDTSVPDSWLDRLTPTALQHHDALSVLRVAMLGTQEADVGD